VGLIAASIPPLKALFENVLRSVFGVRSQGRSTTTGYATKNTGTRRSRTRDLEDDEIAMRNNAACMHSSNEFQLHQSDRRSVDGRSSVYEDKHAVIGSRELHVKTSIDDSGERGPITKTVSYTVRRDNPHGDTR
jgi:hypothetical protein